MTTENKTLDFRNQRFFIGIDVHQRSWSVTVICNELNLSTFSMNPDAAALGKYLRSHYPGGEYNSVYEAGFCGFSVHRKLTQEGINNIVVSPSEVPTTSRDKDQKHDSLDSKKLAKALQKSYLKGIHIPTQRQQELRSLVRLRNQQVRAQVRLKNQIKGYLSFYGHKIPQNYDSRHWSRAFIEQLKKLEFCYPMGKQQLMIQLDTLTKGRETMAETVRSIKRSLKELELDNIILLLTGIPGIGFITAVNIYCELLDIRRFNNFDQLAKYCGVVPSVRSSSDKEISSSLSRANNRRLREFLIESAWVAVRKDPALTACYNEYIKRMSKQEAITRIAKKLLNRIRYVWTTGKPYVCSVLK